MPQLRRANWSGLAPKKAAPKGPAAGGPPASMMGAGVMIDEQGPTQAGGTLAGITAPGVSRDIIQSRFGPRIDFGPIFRPRSTGANPLTGDPFQATTGVGGFFRRLLGDNADELNAQWQQARIANQLAAQGKADERAFELEKLKLADQLAGTREAAGREFTKELQGQQQGFLLGQAMNKEIADSADREAQREFVKGQNLQRDIFETLKQEAANAQRMKELEMTGNAALDKALLGGRAPAPGKWSQVGDMYVNPEGQMMQFDLESNSMVPVRMPGVGPAAPDDLTEDKRNAVREKTAQLKAGQMYFPDFPREEPKIEQWDIPGMTPSVSPQMTGLVGIPPALSADMISELMKKTKPKKTEYIGSSSIPKLW